MDLLSLVLTLRPTATATLPPRLGRAAQAILFARLAAADPTLATTLHDDEGPKPFTCSDLLGPRRRQGEVTPEQTYTLRYTALTAPVAAALAAAFTVGERLTFEGVDLEVLDCAPPSEIAAQKSPLRNPPSEITPPKSNSPWVGSDDYQALAAQHLLPAGPAPEPAFSFLLAAPTAFKSQGKTAVFPQPELFFGSLANRWNAFAPVALPEEGVRRYAEELVVVSRFTLKSAPGWDRGPGLRIGAIGEVTFRALNRDRYWLAVLGLLAAFALYAGVGTMTTAGMGQVRAM